jgi:hypothetical protein
MMAVVHATVVGSSLREYKMHKSFFPSYFCWMVHLATFFCTKVGASARFLAASLTSLETYMEVQKDKKITKRPC